MRKTGLILLLAVTLAPLFSMAGDIAFLYPIVFPGNRKSEIPPSFQAVVEGKNTVVYDSVVWRIIDHKVENLLLGIASARGGYNATYHQSDYYTGSFYRDGKRSMFVEVPNPEGEDGEIETVYVENNFMFIGDKEMFVPYSLKTVLEDIPEIEKVDVGFFEPDIKYYIPLDNADFYIEFFCDDKRVTSVKLQKGTPPYTQK